MTESTQTLDQVVQSATESTPMLDLPAQPTTESRQMPDQAAQTLKDSIATAVKLLRRMGEDLEGIQSTVYVSVTALRAPDEDVSADVAKVMDGVYVKLVEDVDDDVRNALKALDQARCACGDDVATAEDHSDV